MVWRGVKGWTTRNSDRIGQGSDRGSRPGNGQGQGSRSGEQKEDLPAGSLGTPSHQLATQLNFLRQEEKLAHDLYELADSRYGAKPFNKIAQAEVKHAQAIDALLAGYSMPDPSTELVSGGGVYSECWGFSRSGYRACCRDSPERRRLGGQPE